jgi:hypothetical protein
LLEEFMDIFLPSLMIDNPSIILFENFCEGRKGGEIGEWRDDAR